MVCKHLFVLILYSLIGIVISVKPSIFSIWSNQREIKDFILDKQTNDVYVAAIFLYHLDHLDFVIKSMFENHEYTATNVITFSESNNGFACSKVTGLCFLFNSSDVSQIEGFDKEDFIPNTVSGNEIPDLDLLAVKIRGAESVSFLIADERIASQAYYIRIHPYTSFMDGSFTPELTEVFSGAVSNDAIIRRTLLSYTREGFIYYVVRQQEISGQYSLYVMRMCENEDSGDIRIHSLVELLFSPCDSSKEYPQNAARGNLDNFFQGEVLLITYTSGESGVDSNLCVFTQYNIDIAFDATIQSCKDGSPDIRYVLPWLEIGGVHPTCSGGLVPDSSCDLCSMMFPTSCLLYNYTGIAGTEISGYDLNEYEKITALFPLSIDEVDFIFIGSEIGDLKKYELTSYNSIGLIEDFNLGNLQEAPFSKMLATSNSEYMYASRSTLLYKIDIINCQLYTSCEDCVGTEDPICGYCSLTETCTRKSECANPNLSLRWITNNSNNCLSLNSITPGAVQVGENTEVAVSINNLPQLQSPHLYQCDFAQTRTNVSRIVMSGVNVNLTGPETPGHSVLYCDAPKEFTIPNDYKEINFSMLSTELNGNFASQTNGFAFYNCNIHPRCENCTISPAPCVWCLYNSICTHSDSLCEMESIPPSSNSTLCPAVTESSGLSVHIGNATEIDVLELVMVNAPEAKGGFNYSCVYTFLDTTMVTREGIWQSSAQVDCIPPPHLYTSSGSETADLQLRLGKNGVYYDITEEPIQNVTIFNCEAFQQTCSLCFGRGGPFGCGNCYRTANITGDPTCRLEIQCDIQRFLNNSLACPDPTILNFEPKGGHADGGTQLIISGENLGGSRDDLAVRVANVSCEITSFVIGKIINCTTGMFKGENPIGIISVSVKEQIINSTANFSYLLPTIASVYTYFPNNSISPALAGIVEGGTRLLFQGNNMGIVSNISIKDEIKCVIQNGSTPTLLESPAISCMTDDSSEPAIGVITLASIEGHKLNYQEGLFSYQSLEIRDGLIEPIIPAGGIRVTIRPNNHELIHDTKLLIVSGSSIVGEEECTEISPFNDIVCVSPVYTYSEGLVAQLVVDNLTLQVNEIEIKARNPVCENNPTYTDSIIIRGSDFLFVAEEHYTISITSSSDAVDCHIIIYSEDVLECRPDKEISGTLFVQIGYNWNCTFNSPVSPESNINQYIISAASTLLLMLILSVFLISCFVIAISYYKYKKVREIESLIHQYSKMESNIAKECKTGFAELQVEIVDFVQAAETNTIPFTDYQTYVVKLLFSRNQSVEFLSLPPNDPLKANEDIETFRRAMKLFQELLNNKEFLIELIRVFDQNQDFDASEKTYFASLLMVALHKNLFYATEILKVLIDDLIARNLNRPHQEMKILFRSTSVCEKLLSHWLALCMYNYLKGRPGEELYSLYSAIKVQINKGPIDAITGEAKYSLNQDNILRMTIEVNEFEILCHFGENLDSTKLLDCDTITQVKRKIIDTLNKNMLASEKPDPDQLELIYVKARDFSPTPIRKHGQNPGDIFAPEVFTNPIYTPGDETMLREIPTFSRVKQPYLLFKDIDKTSGIDLGWRRINTMKHYFTLFNIHSPQEGSFLLMLQSDLKEKFPSLYIDTTKRKSTEASPKIFHFSIPGSPEATLDRQRVVSEVYFTKLLSTKAILQKYIDEMMNSIFPDRITSQQCPIAIKHLFNFLEERARFYNITDPEVIHTWKNNSVVLRFWVNLLKNPQFILDIDMPSPVDSTLSTIAQGLIDSCSTRDEELTKDSPANKLLFAKDTKLSRKRVKKFYEDLQNFHQTQSSFNQHLRQMQLTNSPFFVESAVQEIFLVWISGTSFVGNLLTRLREQKLDSQVTKFTQVLNMMSDSPTYDDATSF